MRASSQLTRYLGTSGVNAVGRIVGIVVAAIAVQLVIDGTGEITRAAIH
jgi:small neutral amino acid transporter SnatA (MarC family)